MTGELDADSDLACALQSNVEELEALQAVYGDDLTLTAVESANLEHAQAALASRGSGAADVPALSGTLSLPSLQLGGATVQLAFVLARLPGRPPGLQVHANAPRHVQDELQSAVNSAAAECASDGAPCLLVAADRLTEAAAAAAAAERERQQAGEQPAAAAGGSDGRQGAADGSLALSRRCVWFHHIKNLTKRKSILQWGSELRLGGWSKPGFPGVLLVEGAAPDVAEYLARLRRLRWQAMAVRAEEDLPMCSHKELEAARTMPVPVQELGEEEMGRLGAAARAAGAEELFRAALKLGAP